MNRPTKNLVRCCCASLLAVALGGCEESAGNADESADTAKQEMKKEVGEAAEATADYAATKQKEFAQRLSARMEDVSTRIDTLQDKAGELGQDAKAELKDTIDALEAKRDQVAGRLEELRGSAPDAWEDMKAGLTRAMDDLENAYEQAKKELDNG